MPRALRGFSRDELRDFGFEGWVRFAELTSINLPTEGGVYVVYRTTSGPPTFRATNPAGRHKRRDPTVPVERLTQRWIDDCSVVYIGKATSLAERLHAYRKHGLGQPAGHWGGRLVWQCDDIDSALVAWTPTLADPEAVEAELLTMFEEAYGRLPFANLKRGRRSD